MNNSNSVAYRPLFVAGEKHVVCGSYVTEII